MLGLNLATLGLGGPITGLDLALIGYSGAWITYRDNITFSDVHELTARTLAANLPQRPLEHELPERELKANLPQRPLVEILTGRKKSFEVPNV